NNSSAIFQRSTDGGVTWQSPVVIPNSPIYGTLDVDTNGNLFVGGWSGGTTFRCERSSNAQIGGQTPTFDRNTAVSLGGTIVQGGINGVGLCGRCSWPSTTPAAPLTTTSICWPVSSRSGQRP